MQYRFQCTGCGHCCTGGKNYYVAATRAEQRRIQKFLKIGWAWFRRRYVVRVDAHTEGLTMAGGACAFLDGQRCRIYNVRPAQCRTYPFWPELADPKIWRAESKRCEGIGRGAPLSGRQLRVWFAAREG